MCAEQAGRAVVEMVANRVRSFIIKMLKPCQQEQQTGEFRLLLNSTLSLRVGSAGLTHDDLDGKSQCFGGASGAFLGQPSEEHLCSQPGHLRSRLPHNGYGWLEEVGCLEVIESEHCDRIR